MPGETLETGATHTLHKNLTTAEAWPEYHTVRASRSHRTAEHITQVQYFQGLGYKVLEDDFEAPKGSGHPDIVVMGCAWDMYFARKKEALDEANDFGQARPDNWDEMERTEQAPISHKEAIDALPMEAPPSSEE